MKGFLRFFFLFPKNTIVNKIFIFTTNTFSDEVVNNQRNIYKAFKFVSVVKNVIYYRYVDCQLFPSYFDGKSLLENVPNWVLVKILTNFHHLSEIFDNFASRQRDTYRVLQTIQMKLILLNFCVSGQSLPFWAPLKLL